MRVPCPVPYSIKVCSAFSFIRNASSVAVAGRRISGPAVVSECAFPLQFQLERVFRSCTFPDRTFVTCHSPAGTRGVLRSVSDGDEILQLGSIPIVSAELSCII